MDARPGPQIAAALARRARDGVPAAQIASDVAEAWHRAESSLNPIIGPAGVVALWKRSLQLAGRAHPTLVALFAAGQSSVDVEALSALLGKHKSNDAALVGGELLETFYGLLSSMVGPSLTRKLLHFMWRPFEESAHGTRHD